MTYFSSRGNEYYTLLMKEQIYYKSRNIFIAEGAHLYGQCFFDSITGNRMQQTLIPNICFKVMVFGEAGREHIGEGY